MKNPFKTNTKKIETDILKLQKAVFKPKTWNAKMAVAMSMLGNFGDGPLYADVEANTSRIKDLEEENKQLKQKIDMLLKHFNLKEKKIKAKTAKTIIVEK